ncbi:MAG: hypothetical protein EA388_00340 [Nitriliruptor sp.]|nr:MAG: hypothetical protein EA388_00340 [Nitriliruptor sp.]
MHDETRTGRAAPWTSASGEHPLDRGFLTDLDPQPKASAIDIIVANVELADEEVSNRRRDAAFRSARAAVNSARTRS